MGAAALGVLLDFVVLAPRAQAQRAEAPRGAPADCPATDPRAVTRWAAPLDRVVRVVAPDSASTTLSLRAALDRLAAVARVRLSYSRELLPLDRPTCLDPAPAALGAVLERLLRGTGVQPVGVGDDQVVLAPATPGAAAPVRTSAVAVLERVVVTGSAAGAPTRRLPFTLDVVDGATLGASNAASGATAPLAATLDGRVPGLWLWAQPPTAVLTRYGSLRGASSFGVSAPKLYLDGIEVANPLVVTELPAERVARVEVIRGPQGAALYGADAISGVINVVTRTDGADGGTRTLTGRGGLGATQGAADRRALAQDYALFLRTGTGARTAGASFGVSALGPYAPGAATRRLTATGSLRQVARTGTLTLTGRVADALTSTPTNPLLGTPVAALPDQRLQQVTAGATATRATGGRWTHTLTAGVDAYRLTGVATNVTPVLAQLDSAQRSARGGAARATLRASSTATLDVAPRVRASLTGMADYGLLRDATADGAITATYSPAPGDAPNDASGNALNANGPQPHAGRAARSAWPTTPDDDRGPNRPMLDQVTWLSTTGLVGQATLALDDALFVTAGLRGERNDGFTRASRFAALPSLGVSWVRQQALGTAGARGTVKLRAAYGSGLRPARSAARATLWRGAGALGANLQPESQRGVEAGVDLYVDGAGPTAPAFAVHATRFDQQAANLLQQVPVEPPGGWQPPITRADSMHRGAKPFGYAVENVGWITNRGWEFAGDLRAGPLTLAATLALVDSRVARLAAAYTGDLRAGDRTLEVPRRTLGVNAVWRRAGWSAALGAARASDWINYDRLALARDAAPGTASASDFVGARLRAYWRPYAGVTRLSASAARDVGRGLTLVLTGDNLLDRQQGEPDNATVLPGRTVTAGVRARF